MNQKRNFTVNWKNIWIAIILLVFIKPPIAEDIEILDYIFNAARIGFSIFYIGYMLVRLKKINKDWLYLLGIFTCVFTMTVNYGGFYSKAITHYIPSLGLLAFAFCNKKNLRSIIVVAVKLGFVLLTLNLITFILFPNGIIFREISNVRVWLLGQKQDLPGFVFPMIYFAMIWGYIDKKYRKTHIYMYFFSVVTVFAEQSIAALVCLVGLGVLCLFDNFFSQKIKKSVLISVCIATFGIMQYISYNFSSMLWLQALLLKIDTIGATKVRTLSTRFSMWKFAWNTFFENPILGKGELSTNSWMDGVGFYHSVLDNLYMDILMTAGLVGVILFLFLLRRSFNTLNKYNLERHIRYMSYCLFTFCIYNFFGSPFYPLAFFMMLTAAWFPQLILNEQKDDKQ